MAGDFGFEPLGKLVSIQGGFAFKSHDFGDTGVPVLKIKNIRLRDVETSDLEYVSEDVAKANSRFFCKHGDLLISMTGSGPQAPNSVVGRVARFTGPSDKFLINQRVGRFVVKEPSKLDSRFLFYFLTQEQIQWSLVSIATGSANQANISSGQIESLEVPVPPLKEQQAMACILGALDDKIELNRQMNQTLEAMARAIFKSWFVDFDPVRAKAADEQPPGLAPQIAELFPDSFEDSELGQIPQGWRVGTFGEVAQERRRSIRADDIPKSTPYIALEHMPRRSIALDQWVVADGVASGKLRFSRGDILFGKLRPYFHKVGVAPVDGVCSTDIIVLGPRSPELAGVVLGHSSSDEFIAHTDRTSAGTKMPRTNWRDMSQYRLVILPPNVAGCFSDVLAPFIQRIQHASEENRILAAFRDALLPKLISGELRVPDTERIVRKAQ